MTDFGDVPNDANWDEQGGFNVDGTTRRGLFEYPVLDTATNESGLIIPDLVTVEVPDSGLIWVMYRALIKASGGTGLSASITLNGDPVRIAANTTDPQENASPPNGISDPDLGTKFVWIYTSPAEAGLTVATQINSTDATLDGADVTGFAIASPVPVEVAAGTHEVGIDFAISGGTTMSIKDRKLWAWTQGFG